ncbi:MAG: hypothetical protein ACIAS6_13840 [Phycisphaerales bacterium JB060]
MIESMLQSFQDPHSRHAVLVHFPIVLGALGLIPVAALAVLRFRSRVASAACIAWFVLAMAGLGLASGAGEEAYERVEEAQPPLTQAEHDALEEHESRGEGAWLWALPAVVRAAATLVPRAPVRIAAGVLLVAAAGTLSGFVAVTGHTGGKLVYEHGLGVPQRASGAATTAGAGRASGSESRERERYDDDDDR